VEDLLVVGRREENLASRGGANKVVRFFAASDNSLSRSGLRVMVSADPRRSTPIHADLSRGRASAHEAVPYTPKDLLFWNGLGMSLGARSVVEHGATARTGEDPR